MFVDYCSIGARIKYFRTQRELSQEDLAEKADMARSHIANMERGEKGLSVESLLKIANALNVTADMLLVDNLDVVNGTYDGDDTYVLLDCTPEETEILVKNMKELKAIIRKYKITK